LASLYNKHQNLFSKIVALKSVKNIYEVLNVSASLYWQNHYQFDKESPKKSKPLSKSFIDLLIINTIIPVQFAYASIMGESIEEDLIALLKEVLPEKNSVIDKFESFGVSSKNAFDTQTLLQLKNEYCSQNACLKCAVGMELLRNN